MLSIDLMFPSWVDLLLGDHFKAKSTGWEPEIQLPELVEDMMTSDLKLMQKDRFPEMVATERLVT